MSAFSISESRC